MNKAKDYRSSDVYKVCRVVYKPNTLLIVRIDSIRLSD